MDFYVIDRSNRFNDTKYAYGEEVEQKTGNYETCQVCGAPVSLREWLSPRKVKLSKPSYGDFVFGTFSTFLCSDNVKEEYVKLGLKGIIEFQEVEIVKVNKKKATSSESPKYYNAKIRRGNARINEELSKFIREDQENFCEVCRTGTIRSFNGIYIESDTWNGEDIFYPIGLPGTILVSRKFYDFVISKHFTNINFIPAEKYVPSWIK